MSTYRYGKLGFWIVAAREVWEKLKASSERKSRKKRPGEMSGFDSGFDRSPVDFAVKFVTERTSEPEHRKRWVRVFNLPEVYT